MTQDRLADLGILSIENELTKTVDFETVIDFFAHQKARKVHLI